MKAEVVALWVKRLGHDEFQQREEASSKLWELAQSDPRAVLRVMDEPTDDPEIQARCSEIREKIDDLLSASTWIKRDAAARIFSLLENEEEQVRTAAAAYLAQVADLFSGSRVLGRDDPEMKRLYVLGDPSAESAAWRKDLLSRVSKAEAAARMAPLFSCELVGVRRAALRAYGVLEGKPLLPEVSRCLVAPDLPARQEATRLLAIWKTPASDVGSHVVEHLGDDDPIVRRNVISHLARAGSKAHAARIAARLADKDLTVRRAAVDALACVGDRSLAFRIAERLRDESPLVQQASAVALKAMAGDTWPADAADEVAAAQSWWEKHRKDPEYQAK